MASPETAPQEGRPPDPAVLRDLITTSVIAKVAAEELPLVESLHGLDDAAALRILTRRPRRSEPLGFGLEAVGALLTPVLWIAVDAAVRRVVDSTAERASQPGGTRRWLFLRRREPQPPSAPTLTRDQLETVERCVLEAAGQARLSRDRAERIADGVVRRLALARPGDQPTGAGSGDGA